MCLKNISTEEKVLNGSFVVYYVNKKKCLNNVSCLKLYHEQPFSTPELFSFAAVSHVIKDKSSGAENARAACDKGRYVFN